jgi:flagellar hook-associated protein 3 FlgL
MIVNKSMFPLQTGFSVLSKMQARMSDLQVQLGTGQKSSSLAGMGRDLPLSVSARSRLSAIEGFAGNISTVNLRLSFYSNAMERFDKIETEARNSALPSQYGTGDINMATLPGLSHARFDEVVTLLNSDIDGRYIFGGSVADRAPLPSTNALLEGEGGRAGFRTIVAERKAADAGADGRGRLTVATAADTVTLSEDGAHPFGFKLSTVSTSGAGITATNPTGSPASLGITVAAQPVAGQSITLGFTLPDGTETQVTLKAVAAGEGGAPGTFEVGADEAETAANIGAALGTALETEAGTTLSAASTFAAANNFFAGAGEPILRVSGSPASAATALEIADPATTVTWYRGEIAAISADNLGRLDVGATGSTVGLTESVPVSARHGFTIAGVSAPTANIATSYTSGDPSDIAVDFTGVPTAGESVTVTLAQPDGTSRTVTLTAVNGRPQAGQFSIGATPEETAANFQTALREGVHTAAKAAEGNPRQSVSAQVDESTRVNYGVQATETGLLKLMRTLASMSVETYSTADSTARGRFDAMASRQQSEMSESHNSTAGSVEIITMELGIAQASAKAAQDRHTNYKVQLENLLSDAETVSKEDVAVEILALQTRLQASYQVTAMVSQLSLANFL